MRELVAPDDRQSLEGRGLLRVRMDRPENVPLPPALTHKLGLDEDEAWDLLSELVRTLRQQGALTMPEGVAPDDEAFSPRRGPIYVRESGPDYGGNAAAPLGQQAFPPAVEIIDGNT